MLGLKNNNMKLNMNLFNWMFSNYYDYKTPMWSTWKEEGGDLILEIAVPGYDEKDFALHFGENGLELHIDRGEKTPLEYSIVGDFYGSRYKLDDSKATYKSGILKITIPKAQKKMKQIPIKVS
jgi:HSP20 family molecular chaperone IbpA